ncbi:MAG: TetR/AcrR family transcriptional regulator [candidate division Zixibacteria bacterium]|nr:TetR/AcrR family transcriptional regulator [candidate division Zixibacteria bacterium]
MDRKTVIIESARLLFMRYGLRKTTTDDIAGKARVSKATIYKYYKNKEEIFNEVIEFEAEELWKSILKAVDKEKTVREKLRARFLAKIGKIHELINFYGITRETWKEYRPHIADVRERILAKDKELVLDILSLGNKANEFQVDRGELLSHLIVVSLQPLEYPWELSDQEISLPHLADFMVDLMLNGIRKR